MWTKVIRKRMADRFRTSLERAFVATIERSFRESADRLSPRQVVDMMTMSSFELGRMFKQALRDELYEQCREAERRRDPAGHKPPQTM